MHNQLRQIITYLVLPVLIGIFLMLSRTMASATVPASPVSPASQFTDWEQWSAPIDSNQFDITQCSPDVAGTEHIQVGDMNGDGRIDLLCKSVAPNGGTTPYVQLAGQDSYSAWDAWRTIAVEPGCEFDLVADFNGDGLDDWLCSLLWQGRYESFYFRSSGNSFSSVGFSIASVDASQFDLNRCQKFFVEDVNLDGREDAICHYLYPDNSSATHMALDDGEFTHNWDLISPVSAPNVFRLDFCGALDSGDVDGNGQLDQICSYQYPDGSSATWVQLAMSGSYGAWQRWSETSEASEFSLNLCHYFHAVDVNGDSLIDLLCMYQDGNDTGVLVQTDGLGTTGLQYGHWETWFELTTDIIGCRPFGANIPEVIDIDGDGMSDILCAYRNGAGSMTTWIQRSTGTAFGSWEAWTPSLSFDLDRCYVLIASDINKDQHSDIICPYLYPDGSTATFVQRVVVYRIALPIITH